MTVDAAIQSSPRQSSPRLRKLRSALLDADYGLCTQKAALLTDHLRSAQRSGPLLGLLERAHYSAYSRSLRDQVHGKAAAGWKNRLQDGLLSVYDRLDPSREPAQLTYARAFAHVVENVQLSVYPGELIVGNLSSHRIGAPLHPDFGGLMILPELSELPTRAINPIMVSETQVDELRESIFPFWFRRSVLAQMPRCTDDKGLFDSLVEGRDFVVTQFAGISHLTPDYPSVVDLGFGGIRKRIREQLLGARAEGHDTTYLESAEIVTTAAIRFGDRWRRHLAAVAADETDEVRAAELRQLAEIFERVPEHPARTFHEGLQSVFAAHVLVHQESFQHGVSFGRMDQYLIDLYRRDVSQGLLDEERAIELIGCFLGKAAELVPLFFEKATEYFSGLSSASGITLGGVTAAGEDAANELSHLFLKAYDQMRLRQPNIHVRLHPGTDERFRSRCFDVISRGGGMPALFNDEEVIPAMVDSGISEHDALDYSIVGCAEWGVPYKSFPAAGAGFVNLAQVLVHSIQDDPSAPASTQDLLDRFRQSLRRTLRLATAANDAVETAHAEHRPTPFLSSIVGGCLESGFDVTSGGAAYNSTGLQGVGLADVADSLAAVERFVLDEGTIPWSALLAALDNDFGGEEKLQAVLTHRIGKYGEDDGRAGHFAQVVSSMFIEEVGRFENPRGGPYLAGFWTMTTHQGFGRRTASLPSGRRSREALSNGISPSNGRDRRGATAALLDASRVRTPPNGCVTNQKLSPDLAAGEEGRKVIAGLVDGYFALGGPQVQFNVLDPAVLIAARDNPHLHRDLVVRISGYSAYFNDLSPEMKDELIARTLHSVA